MKTRYIALIFFFLTVFTFGDNDEKEEIDFLLFEPNLSDRFTNEENASIRLDEIAKGIIDRNLKNRQIYVYGYAAFAQNDIDPLKLSEDRANFIVSELHKRGVPRNLFAEQIGFGSVNLWGNNENEIEKMPNRRVRILLNIDASQELSGVDPIRPEPDKPDNKTAFSIGNIFKRIGDFFKSIGNFFRKIWEFLRGFFTKEEKSGSSGYGYGFPWWILIILIILALLVAFVRFVLPKIAGGIGGNTFEISMPMPAPSAHHDFSSSSNSHADVFGEKKGKFAEYTNEAKEPTNTGALQSNTIYRQCETTGTEHECYTKTDSEGRIVEVYARRLCENLGGRDKHASIADLVNTDPRYQEHIRPGDEGGHLIANSVGGSRYPDNVVPMKGELNRGEASEWRKMERDVYRYVKQGKNVENFRVQVLYNKPTSRRPSGFTVTYDLDGGTYYSQFFSND
jgi:hypothetical protein